MPDLNQLLSEALRRPENNSGPAAFMTRPSDDASASAGANVGAAPAPDNAADRKGIPIPSISLPQGGGAMRSIDEKFKVNSSNGTASFSLPLPLSPGRPGSTGGADSAALSPTISLSYNSGGGNSEFGVGWGLDYPCITRRTDKALPRYRDAADEDVFVLSGAEDLVPVEGVPGQYRPRIESGFMRIERIGQGGDMYWVVRSGDNTVSVYGQSAAARLADPAAVSERVFKWCLEYSYDDKGNIVKYVYKKEDTVNVSANVWDQNRLSDLSPFTNLYLKSVHYGNTAAWHPGDQLPAAFYFSMVLDYGDEAGPGGETSVWPARRDAFSSFRAGFEIRTYRLCRRVLMYHHFETELGEPDRLVRSLDFAYDEQPHLTYLSSVTQTGYILDSALSLPPLVFDYIKPGFSNVVREAAASDLMNAPTGLDHPLYQFTDLYSEGIAGILSEQAGSWFYKSNIGNGHFTPAYNVGAKPSLGGLGDGGLSLQDLEGDGRKYLVSLQQRGYFAISAGDDPGFVPGGFEAFDALPNIDWHDAGLRYIDLDGDGMPDLLMTSNEDIIWYRARGRMGYDGHERLGLAIDEEKGPRVLLANKDQQLLIATADMSGDGMSDLVVISNDRVAYYPNLGYGRFGARVTMELDDAFDSADVFDPSHLLLGDIDGSGTTDIVYTGSGTIRVWFNQAGNGFSAPSSFFNPFPSIDGRARLSLVDLLGTGLSCLVWSSSLAADALAPLRYIDLMNGQKPHLLSGYRNNLGKEISLSYRASTQYYLDDKLRGLSWATRLPFAVQCVSKVVVVDRVAQTRVTNEYSYHHGYYDAREREFRGFAMVEQTDSEEYDHFAAADGGTTDIAGFVFGARTDEIDGSAVAGSVPIEADLFQTPVLTRSWFHTGAWLHREQVFHQLQQEYFADGLPLLDDRSLLPEGLDDVNLSECFRALKGLPLREEVYGLDLPGVPFSVVQHSYDVQLLQGGSRPVFFPRPKETLTFQYERVVTDPRIAHSINLSFDGFGNVLESVSIAYGRLLADASLPSDEDRAQQGKTLMQYAKNSFTAVLDAVDLWRLPVVCETQLFELPAAAPVGQIYTLAEVAVLAAGGATLFAHHRTLFMRDDLSGPLPFGVMGVLGLPYESYTLAFMPATAAALFADKFADVVWRQQAGLVSFDNDGNYWIRSGRASFDAAAFFLPVRFEDAFGNVTTVSYDGYSLMTRAVVDAAGNVISAGLINYRVMSPVLVRDANGNGQGVRFDELGRLVANFAMGKADEGEGDVMDLATVEASSGDQPGKTIGYELRYYVSGGVLGDRTLVRQREEHSLSARWLELYVYSDGSGHEVLHKEQAEPDAAGAARWIGKGFAIFNNKGNVVKSYEPFFDSSPEFKRGGTIASVNYYDALGRLVKTASPDGSFSMVSFDAWKKVVYDANDTVRQSDWYAARVNGQLGPDEQAAAERAAVHADTPTVTYFDGLGRGFCRMSMNVIQRNDEAAVTEIFYMRSVYDIAGNILRLTDERGNVVMRFAYDLSNEIVYSHSMDSGDRWLLKDAGGKNVRCWDGRGQQFDYTYDMLRRPLTVQVTKGAGTLLYARNEYGETAANAAALNLRGKLYRRFDAAGLLVSGAFDFKGNLLSSARTLVSDYTATPDWSGSPVMSPESFNEFKTYDALNRVVSMVAADGSVVMLGYDESRMLDKVDLRLQGGSVVTPFVTEIRHNAKGQREQIVYGNDTSTRYDHDPQTYRLKRLLTTAGSGARILQDLNYVYDPVGNIVRQMDNAQKTVFYGGQAVAAQSDYIYDALYRLVEASGREHSGQVLPNPQDNYNDGWSSVSLQPNSPLTLRNYTQQYGYDGVGNITSMQHIAGGSAGWTRTYVYDAGSNRLLQSVASGQTYAYTYNEHGSMISMPHLPVIDWDCMEKMQHVQLPSGDAYYVYDGAGQRVRKVVVGAGGFVSERIYLNGLEIYRESRGGAVTLERTSLHVMDDVQRIALVDTLTAGTDGTLISGRAGIVTPGSPDAQLIRYQYGDHLGSAALELDGAGLVISYEEYHPYGTTAFRATDASRQVPAKRYRYTGMERDEETGLNYHAARYYASWLGRWAACDPIGIAGGANVYAYGKGNPVVYSDVSGLSPNRSECENIPTEPHERKPPPTKAAPPKKEPALKPDSKRYLHNSEKGVSDGAYTLLTGNDKNRAEAQTVTSTPIPANANAPYLGGEVWVDKVSGTTNLKTVILPDDVIVPSDEEADGHTLPVVHRIVDPTYTSLPLPGVKHSDEIVVSIHRAPSVTVHVQTLYEQGISSADNSSYGRGTTPEDVASHDRSLQFHEGNHGKDWFDYVDAHPLPQFKGRVGMTVEVFERYIDLFHAEMDRYMDNEHFYSTVQTDQKGYTRDDYNAGRPKPDYLTQKRKK